jgi:dTDP-4-dehydrorhamnose 3,5-epimerase
MKIIEIKSLTIPDVKVIRFARFCDQRGYFTETFRLTDLSTHPEATFLVGRPFVQGNESFSHNGTIRGMHFQWNPYMGKLVRTVNGHMVDLILDIRLKSPTFGKMIAYDMPADLDQHSAEWIWVPPGFAHGNYFPSTAQIEYLCTGTYSQGCEAGISPLAPDIDWSLCEPRLKRDFDLIAEGNALITDKDRNALTVEAWAQDIRAHNFVNCKY